MARPAPASVLGGSADSPLRRVVLEALLDVGLQRKQLAVRACPAVPPLLDCLVEAAVVAGAEQVSVPFDAAVRIDRRGELARKRFGQHVDLLDWCSWRRGYMALCVTMCQPPAHNAAQHQN